MAYLYKELTYKLRGIFFEVYNQLGPGLSEKIYQRAVIQELQSQEILYESEKVVNINYLISIIKKLKLDNRD